MAQDLVDTRNDPYAAYGAKAAQAGMFLSFSKGEYLYGSNKDELRIGKRLVANMPGLRIGWRCWRGSKMAEDRTELLSDGRAEERRADLGDTDQELWERDDQGEPRDPWVFVNVLELVDPASGEAYVFSTNSTGGKRAIGRLCKEYGGVYRMKPGMLPIVELGRDSYMHSNPRFGKIYNPVFTIVGWTDAGSPSVDDAGEEGPDREDRHVDREGAAGQGQRAVNPTQGGGVPLREHSASSMRAETAASRNIPMTTTSRSDDRSPRF